jgi:hypothetical protein
MLRFKILASVVPLIVAGVFARTEFVPATRPCVALGDMSVQIASAPWQAQLHVSFTDDPATATVRVQIADSAENADFVVIDDADSSEADTCDVNTTTRFIGISTSPSAAEPVIYLSHDNDADYRIFVRSRTFTARDAAALIVGAHGGHPRMAAASL